MNDFQHIRLTRLHGVLFATLNQPASRHALTPAMVAELAQVLGLAESDSGVRALVLRGSQGFFCAGGNVANFQERLTTDAGQASAASTALQNRAFGHFMQRLVALPVPVLAAVEGAAMGGGMGLACAADIVLATVDAKFALSETSLGLIPAQIAPFVVARLGQRVTRRLGLSAERVSGELALQLGLVDALASDSAALDALLAQWLSRIARCAPQANRRLKSLLQALEQQPLAALLDNAAQQFAACLHGEGAEGAEGIAALRAKRPPAWQLSFDADAVRQAHGA